MKSVWKVFRLALIVMAGAVLKFSGLPRAHADAHFCVQCLTNGGVPSCTGGVATGNISCVVDAISCASFGGCTS